MHSDEDKTCVGEALRRIDVLALVDALERHALGEIKMTATQVSAALVLLKKVIPDISAAAGKDKKEKDVLSAHEEALKQLD